MLEPTSQFESIVFKHFLPVFSYNVKNGEPVEGAILNKDLWGKSGVVYARTHENKILYIGKADGPLKTRIMDHLRRIPRYKKTKDIKYRDWAEGKTVTIYAHKPKQVQYLGLSVPLYVGLEHALIDAIKPPYVSRK